MTMNDGDIDKQSLSKCSLKMPYKKLPVSKANDEGMEPSSIELI